MKHEREKNKKFLHLFQAFFTYRHYILSINLEHLAMIRGITSTIFALSTSAVVLTLNVTAIQAQGEFSFPHRLRTEFTGENKCLDIINDGENNKLIMADCGNYSGQLWITEMEGEYIRFKTEFTGESKCLDIINDGENNKLTMADCGNYSGQLWTVEEF